MALTLESETRQIEAIVDACEYGLNSECTAHFYFLIDSPLKILN
jgi:hypothetical protein